MWWTLGAATLGSLTALLIAFGAYPWQKARDRKLSIQSETRRAYLDFLHGFNALDKYTWGWEPHDHYVYNSLRDEFSALYLYAPTSVIEACSEAFQLKTSLLVWTLDDENSKFSRYGKDYSEEIDKATKAEQTMVRLMRADLTGERLSEHDLQSITAQSAFGENK